MRHLKRTAKLGRTSEHRNAMLANMVCSLIKHKRVTTTLAKAKAARSVAEKIVTLGKQRHAAIAPAGGRAFARARSDGGVQQGRPPEMAEGRKMSCASVQSDRARVQGTQWGLHSHHQDGTSDRAMPPQRAILEWVDFTPPRPAAEETATRRRSQNAGDGQGNNGQGLTRITQKHFKARSPERVFLLAGWVGRFVDPANLIL